MAMAIARERHTKMICFIVKFSQGIISRWIKVLSYDRSVGSRALFKVESIYKRSESCLDKHMEKSCNHIPICCRKGDLHCMVSIVF